VTAVGRRAEHGRYVEALLGELALESGRLAGRLDTVFVGGGTPTFTEPPALARLLGALPAAGELTVEANPETIDLHTAELLRAGGVTRVSLGAQSFQPHLLAVLERRAGPDVVRRAFHTLRDVSFDNISLDLLYGVPGQTAADLDRDLAEALALEPEHLSCYELEAKSGTRFTRAHGEELARQSTALEDFFERVVERMVDAGYRWYETASFCRGAGRESADLRAQHNLAVWRGNDYLGVGVGAVSTVGARRWRNAPSVAVYMARLEAGSLPHREIEALDPTTREREHVMLGLRLDEPVDVPVASEAIDAEALSRLERRGLVDVVRVDGLRRVTLTRRGRFLGGAVTAELLA
jgi:coproporphyrinogen III oxidase-like Fe-S oxidoreductase